MPLCSWSLHVRGERQTINEQRNINDIEKSKAEGKRQCCNLKRAKDILDEVTFKLRRKGSGKASHMDMDRRGRVFLAQWKANAWHLRPERTWRDRGPVKRPARLDQSEEREPKTSGHALWRGRLQTGPANPPAPGNTDCQGPFSWASPRPTVGHWARTWRWATWVWIPALSLIHTGHVTSSGPDFLIAREEAELVNFQLFSGLKFKCSFKSTHNMVGFYFIC